MVLYTDNTEIGLEKGLVNINIVLQAGTEPHLKKIVSEIPGSPSCSCDISIHYSLIFPKQKINGGWVLIKSRARRLYSIVKLSRQVKMINSVVQIRCTLDSIWGKIMQLKFEKRQFKSDFDADQVWRNSRKVCLI